MAWNFSMEDAMIEVHTMGEDAIVELYNMEDDVITKLENDSPEPVPTEQSSPGPEELPLGAEHLCILGLFALVSLATNIAALAVQNENRNKIASSAKVCVAHLLLVNILVTVIFVPAYALRNFLISSQNTAETIDSLGSVITLLFSAAAIISVSGATLIALDQYVAVVHSLSYTKWNTKRSAFTSIVIVWILACLMSIVEVIVELAEPENSGQNITHITYNGTEIMNSGVLLHHDGIYGSQLVIFFLLLALVSYFQIKVFVAAKKNSSTIRRNSTFIPTGEPLVQNGLDRSRLLPSHEPCHVFQTAKDSGAEDVEGKGVEVGGKGAHYLSTILFQTSTISLSTLHFDNQDDLVEGAMRQRNRMRRRCNSLVSLDQLARKNSQVNRRKQQTSMLDLARQEVTEGVDKLRGNISEYLLKHEETKTFKISLLVILLIIVCWTPHFALPVICAGQETLCHNNHEWIELGASLIFGCLSPILYVLRKHNSKTILRKLLRFGHQSALISRRSIRRVKTGLSKNKSVKYPQEWPMSLSSFSERAGSVPCTQPPTIISIRVTSCTPPLKSLRGSLKRGSLN